MIKMDGCYADVNEMPHGYLNVSRYLNATGRHIVFSCSWPAYWDGKGMKVWLLPHILSSFLSFHLISGRYVLHRSITHCWNRAATCGEIMATFLLDKLPIALVTWLSYDCISLAGQDSWSSVQNIVNYYITNQDVFSFAAGPGHWNDPDMVCHLLLLVM